MELKILQEEFIMRIALLSDVHGNIISLEAVLADLKQESVDRVVYLGDTATFGSHPHEVTQRLRALTHDCVRGNHDDYVLNPDSVPTLGWITHWFGNQLDNEDRAFLESFKPLIKVDLGGKDQLLCYHGTPRSNQENIFSVTPADALDKMLIGYDSTVFAGGHTHVQMLRQHKGRLVVNVGSVGAPFYEMPFYPKAAPSVMPWAEYAIITWKCGAIKVDLRRIPVDVSRIKAAIYANKVPEPQHWVDMWPD